MKKKQKSKRYKRYIRKQFRKLEKKAKEYIENTEIKIDLSEIKKSYEKGIKETLEASALRNQS